MTITVLDTPVCALGEGPHWDADRGRLSWVDINAGRLLVREADQVTEVARVEGSTLSAAFPLPGPEQAWLLVVDQGFALLHAAGPDAALRRLGQPEAAQAARVRMNDAAADPRGRLWAGSMATDGGTGLGSLYRLDLDGTLTRVLTGLNAANGLGWSPAGDRLYFVDSDPGLLWTADYDAATAALSEVQVLSADLGPGIPDGLAVDVEGCLWIAFYGGGQIRRFDPKGRLVAAIDLPATHPTSMCFGGASRDVLYVTTARVERIGQPERAGDGRVLALDAGVAGVPAATFAGRPEDLPEPAPTSQIASRP